jgi:hypothetical protein
MTSSNNILTGIVVAIANAFKLSEKFVSENSPAILTGVGITGTLTTAYLTGLATFKAADILANEKIVDSGEEPPEPLTNQQKIKLVWKLYIPAAGVGALTVGSIFFSHRVSSKQTAAMVAAYGISERAFAEYKEKVVERLGDKTHVAIRDEIAQDKVNAHPLENAEVIIAGNGEVLCYDSVTGRYFQSTIESIKKAQNDINYEIINHSYASLSSFYDAIGLPATSYSDEVGWNLNNSPMDVTFSATISSDKRPCIVIDFTVAPITGYGNLY